MAERLKVTIEDYILFRNGAYDFRLSDLSKIHLLEVSLNGELAAASTKDRVQFPDYEFSKPINDTTKQNTKK